MATRSGKGEGIGRPSAPPQRRQTCGSLRRIREGAASWAVHPSLRAWGAVGPCALPIRVPRARPRSGTLPGAAGGPALRDRGARLGTWITPPFATQTTLPARPLGGAASGGGPWNRVARLCCVGGTRRRGEPTAARGPLATSAGVRRGGGLWVLPPCGRGVRFRPLALACTLLYLKVGSL